MKEKLIKIRQNLGKVMYGLEEFISDKGVILCSVLEAGQELKTFDEKGEIIPLQDGEYTVGSDVIKCSNGKFDLGEEPQNDPQPNDDKPSDEDPIEPTVEDPEVIEDEVTVEDVVTLSKEEHESLMEQIEDLNRKVTELSAQPVIDLVDDKPNTKESKVELKGIARYSQYINK